MAKPWNASSNPARYEKIPGSARRYLDKATGKSISYDQRYKALHGERRVEVTAKRYGFSSAQARRQAQPTELRLQPGRRKLRRQGYGGLLPGEAGARQSGIRVQRETRARRNLLAEQWARTQAGSGVSVPLVRSRRPRDKGSFRPNLTWAGTQPSFLDAESRLSALTREHPHPTRADDPAFAPDGEMAQILVELGMRPADAWWNVGDSPTGTAQATLDVGGGGGGTSESEIDSSDEEVEA